MYKYVKPYFVISGLIVMAIGLTFGMIPEYTMDLVYGISVSDESMVHILRTLMGLYIVFGFSWIYYALSDNFQYPLHSQKMFLLGLILGRLYCFVFLGLPEYVLLFFFFSEVFGLIINIQLTNYIK